MKLSRLGGAVGALALLLTGPAWAQQDTTSAPTLQQQIQDLDQRIRVLDRLRELAAEAEAQAAKTRVSATAGANGFSLKSADANFVIRFRGYVQADGRFYGDDTTPLTDSFILRRVRPILEGTMDRIYDFRIMPDFGGSAPSLYDAYLQARFHPAFAVRAGKFKPPVGLERLQSATDVRFVERGLPTNLVPSRDLGLQASGSVANGVIGYEAGIMNGVPDLANGDSDLSDGKDLVGRLFVTPFAPRGAAAAVDLGIGLAASTGREEGAPASAGLPAYRSPGQVTIFRYRSSSSTPATGTVYADGRRSRIAPQAYLNSGPLGLLAEYVRSRNVVSRDSGADKTTATLNHSAWQISGSWFLTGERNGFKTVAPKRPLDPAAHTWGALELATRYGEIDFDDAAFEADRYADKTASVTRARALGVGVNWHLSRGFKIDVNYERTTFTGGASTGNRRNENFFATQFQTSF